MDYRIRGLALASSILLLLSCSSKNNNAPVAPLTKIEKPIQLQRLWSTHQATDNDENFGSRLQMDAKKNLFNLRPLIVGDQILVIDKTGLVKSLSADTGEMRWSFETGLAAITGLAGNQEIIIASSRDGDLVAYQHLQEGLEKLWGVQLQGEIRALPIVDKSELFVRTASGQLVAISLSDGTIQWTLSRQIPTLSLTGTSAPVVSAERVIAGFDDGRLVAFDRANGQTLWETRISHPVGRTEIERLVDIDGQFILQDGIIYVSSYQGKLSAVQAISGDLLWSRQFSSFHSIVADAEALYLSDSSGHIWSIDRNTGKSFWKQDILSLRKATAPQLLGEHIIVADFEGYLHWLNKIDGSLVGRIRPSFFRNITQPQRWQDRIITLDISGHLYAVRPHSP